LWEPGLHESKAVGFC